MQPFKYWLNKKVITAMADNFKRNWPEFNKKGFVSDACNDLESLALKARSEQITYAMYKHLPANYSQAAEVMVSSLGPQSDEASNSTADSNGISGWAVMSLTHYVALYGHDDFDLSMDLLKEMTKRMSSEFAIRFYLQKSQEKTLRVLRKWAKDNDHHVRRLASEGSRPLLPWGMKLHTFASDPSPVIEILELLKDDESEYVRRSVANNLNDIAKNHPDLVADIASKWFKNASKERQKMIQHACRTLIKEGHKKVLKSLGYGTPVIKDVEIKLTTRSVEFGEAIEFSLTLVSASAREQALMVDYVIHHQKANGSISPKVFKWRKTKLAARNKLSFTKKHLFKKITTRVYHPGLHKLEVVVNGVSVGICDFELTITS